MAKSYRAAAIAYGALLLGFTSFVLLDSFALKSVKQTDATEINLSLFSEETNASAQQTTLRPTSHTAKTSGTTSHTASGTSLTDSSSTVTQSATIIHTAPDDTSADHETVENNAAPTEQITSATTRTTLPPETTVETEPPVIINDTTYQDENISISLLHYTEYETEIYVADVRLNSAQYLKTAFAHDTFGKNITAKTSEIAAAHSAILAINGDFYGTHNRGYVIRNGVLYRDIAREETDFLCVMADGSFFLTTSDEYTGQDLLDMGAWQCFMFGPRLIENGVLMVDENSEVDQSMESNPRTAIGIVDELHYLFVVSDGRTAESAGLSLQELAIFMQNLGAQTAYNLDGGGSATMVFNGNLINKPTTSGNSIKERSVSDIVYIGY